MNKDEDLKGFVTQVSNLVEFYKDRLSANTISQELIAMGAMVAIVKAPNHLDSFIHINRSLSEAMSSYVEHLNNHEEEDD